MDTAAEGFALGAAPGFVVVLGVLLGSGPAAPVGCGGFAAAASIAIDHGSLISTAVK